MKIYLAFSLLFFLSINLIHSQEQDIIEELIVKYENAHINKVNFDILKKNLIDKNMYLFDDIRKYEDISLYDYLSFFWNKNEYPKFSLNNLKKDTSLVKNKEYIVEISVTRVYMGKSKIVYFFIEAELDKNNNPYSYKIKRIINGGKKEKNIKNLPYVSSISAGLNIMNINELYAKNIGATTAIENINGTLWGASVSFGISNVRFIEGIKFNISGYGNDFNVNKTWSNIDENALYPTEADEIKISSMKVRNVEFNTQIYAIQTVSGWIGKSYWQKTQNFRFDIYGILGIKKHFYEFEIDTDNIANMSVENTTFNKGVGVEYWFWFINTSEGSIFIEYLFDYSINNSNLKLSSDEVTFFNVGFKINFNPLNK